MYIRNLNVYAKKDNKQIITNMNFDLGLGEMLSILGPSGSGKSTLLDYLTCNYSDSLRTEGEIQIMGIVKYISQEDQLHGFFTVRNYLGFYYDLNYGSSIPFDEKDLIINSIAESCGLTSCLDTIVGDIFFKGLSSGQKRRLSIALEIVSKPNILIIDEPTSGLDSYSALKVMELLKNLTKWGITVVCTIHQPNSQIWEILDKTIILAKGHTCYFGKAKEAKAFFEYINKTIPDNYSIPDYILKNVNSDFDSSIKPNQIAESYIKWIKENESKRAIENKTPWKYNSNKVINKHLYNKFENVYIVKNMTKTHRNQDSMISEVKELKDFENNEILTRVYLEIDKIGENINDKKNELSNNNATTTEKLADKREEIESKLDIKALSSDQIRARLDLIESKAHCFDKFTSVLTRSLINILKNPGIILVRLILFILLTLLIGLCYLNLGDKFEHNDIISRIGMICYCESFLIFMSISVLPFYITDINIVKKELNNMLYNPLHYIASQFVVSIIGVSLIAITSSVFIALLSKINGFGIFFLILFLSLFVAESICRFVSLLVPHYIIGIAIAAAIYGIFMLTQGFLIVKDDFPKSLLFLYYLGFHTYSFESFMYNEFSNIKSFNSNQFSDGMALLKLYSMDDTRIWVDVLILISWAVILEIGCLIVITVKFSRKNH